MQLITVYFVWHYLNHSTINIFGYWSLINSCIGRLRGGWMSEDDVGYIEGVV